MISPIGRNPIYRIKGFFIPLEKTVTNIDKNFLTGFTFIEILLVVVILGIIVGISLPNFSKTYLNLLLYESCHNLTYLMRYAQARAIAERIIYRLNFNPDYNLYWLTRNSDIGEDKFIELESRFGKKFNIPEKIKLDCAVHAINFYPDGRIDRINIYLSNTNRKFYTISTEAQSGYVQEFNYKR